MSKVLLGLKVNVFTISVNVLTISVRKIGPVKWSTVRYKVQGSMIIDTDHHHSNISFYHSNIPSIWRDGRNNLETYGISTGNLGVYGAIMFKLCVCR